MSTSTPRVSVVMAAYNAERHLREAVDSILGQTFGDFEFIIIDDASIDSTAEILADYARRDRRVRVFRNSKNIGPFPTGNRGLDVARAPLIARMDADDIGAPDRLERQVAFLDANPDYLFVTTSYRAIDGGGRILHTKMLAADHFGICWLTRFRQSQMHPSICFRSRFPDDALVRYDERNAVAQDCEFFARLSWIGKGATLRDALIDYRTHPTNISSTRKREQRLINLRVAREVQERDLPGYLHGRLDALLRCYLLGEQATLGVIRDSLVAFEEMLARDIAGRPEARTWLRRQSAGLLAEAFLRRGGGLRNPRLLTAFVIHGRHHLWPLVWRILEDKRWLPEWLESFPDPEREASSPGGGETEGGRGEAEAIARRTSVVIPAYGMCSHLEKCLHALDRQSAPPAEIIVFHTGPDNLSARLAGCFPSVRFVHEDARQFAGGARNRGAALSAGERLAFLDSDMVPASDWLLSLSAEAARHPDDVLIGSIGRWPAGGLWARAMWFIEFGSVMPHRRPGRLLSGPGANFAMHRGVWLQGGGFRSDLYAAEDGDLFVRLRGEGHLLRLVPLARADHVFAGGMGRSMARLLELGRAAAFLRREKNLPGSAAVRHPALAVFLPAARLAQIAGRLLREGGPLLEFLSVSPLIAAGLCSWSVGFFLEARRRKRRPGEIRAGAS